MKATQCTVCASAARMQVDADITIGRPVLQISKIYSLGRSALNRHVANGHVIPPAVSPPPAQVAAANGDDDPVTSLKAQLVALNSMSEDGLTVSQKLQLYDARRRAAEALSRTSPAVDQEGPAAKQLKAALAMFEVQNQVLARHPEIAKELSVALREWKAQREVSA